MQALILAGGQGTRLRPLTNTVPKPVLPLAGRPHIAYVLDWLGRHGVDDAIVSCGFLADEMRMALEDVTEMPLRFAEEPDARGTAGAIRFAEQMLGDRFLVLNGDVLTDIDLGAVIEHHKRSGAVATLALHPVDDPTGYGLVRREPDGEITDFLEKPDPDQIDTDEINAGAYVLERSVLDEIPPDREVSIEREVFPKLIGRGLHGVRAEGYWIDIGTPERFRQASWDILERRVETVTAGGLDPEGRHIDQEARVADDAVIGPAAMIGASCRVDRGAQVGPRAVLGDRCEIGEGAVIEGSILLEGCRIGAGAKLRDAILAPGAAVGDGAEPDAGSVIGEGEAIGAAK